MVSIVPASIFFGGGDALGNIQNLMIGCKQALFQKRRIVGTTVKIQEKRLHSPPQISGAGHAKNVPFRRYGAGIGCGKAQICQELRESAVLPRRPLGREQGRRVVVTVDNHGTDCGPCRNRRKIVVFLQCCALHPANKLVGQRGIQINLPCVIPLAEPEGVRGFQGAGGIVEGICLISILLPACQILQIDGKAARLGGAKLIQLCCQRFHPLGHLHRVRHILQLFQRCQIRCPHGTAQVES